jgi:hypothetical protein
MKRFHRACGIFAGANLLLLVGLALTWSLRSPAMDARAAPVVAEKPVEGWYVCRNLGQGGVPGVPTARQRLKLCHDAGWEVYTYCTQPGLPVPPVSRKCTRIGEDLYQCGARNQQLREYRTLQTPVDSPTPTFTQVIFTFTPTLTATLGPVVPEILPTPTGEHRVPPTGEGDSMWLRALLVAEICLILLALIFGGWFIWRVWERRKYS